MGIRISIRLISKLLGTFWNKEKLLITIIIKKRIIISFLAHSLKKNRLKAVNMIKTKNAITKGKKAR